jgi:hypothetical protein
MLLTGGKNFFPPKLAQIEQSSCHIVNNSRIAPLGNSMRKIPSALVAER